MEGSVAEYRFEKAIVRIHPGKLTEEERKVLWEHETRKYLKAVCAARKKAENQKSA